MDRRFAFVIEKPEDLSGQWNTNTLRPLAPMPPLGVLTLGAILRQHGWEVRVFDNSLEGWPSDRLRDEIVRFTPQVVGLSLTSLNAPASLSLAADLADEALPVLAGGPHVGVLPGQVAAAPGTYAAVAGEAEEVIVPLAEAAVAGQQAPTLSGVYTARGGGGVTCPPRDLDALPIPARELIDLRRYARQDRHLCAGPVDSLATSRGCPFQCTFCSNPGNWSLDYRRHRTRSAARVADEMEMLAARYGSEGFFFREDNLTASRGHVLALCDEFERRRFAFPWKCEAHVSTLDEEVLDRMAAAGLKTLWLGIESGSDRILRQIRKGFTVERARRVLLYAKRLGLRTASGFLLGLPGQTAEDVAASVRLAEDTEMDDVWFQVFIGLPGSNLYRELEERGLVEARWHSVLIPCNEIGGFAAWASREAELHGRFRKRPPPAARDVQSYYAAKGAWSRPGTIELACELVPDWGRGRHLDIGCGVGKLLAHARPLRGGRCGIGLDLTYRMLHLARQRFGLPDPVVQGEGTGLPFRAGSFDVVTATEVLEHVTDLDACLAEVARVLAPGGWFSFTMPLYANLLWLDKWLGDRRLRRRSSTAYGVQGLRLGWAPWEPEPMERAVPPGRLLRQLRARGLVPRRAFTRDFFVTIDRSFIGRGLERLAPRLWQRVQRRAGRIDAAAENLGQRVPLARFLGYKIFCVCQRVGGHGSETSGHPSITGAAEANRGG